MKMLSAGKAFISLPILLLLLFILSLAYQFNQNQAEKRQWQYQTQQAIRKELIWQAFEFQVLSKLVGTQAQVSHCNALCLLDISQSVTDNWPNQYQYDEEIILWLFEKEIESEDSLNQYFRLCAKRVLNQSVYCWWLKEEETGQLYWFASLPIRS
jgi:hypothetical protein